MNQLKFLYVAAVFMTISGCSGNAKPSTAVSHVVKPHDKPLYKSSEGRKNRLSITEIAASFSTACAIKGDEVFCWGWNIPDKTVISHLDNPKSLSVEDYGFCLLSGDEPHCWGRHGNPVNISENIKSLVHEPSEFSMIQDFACWLDAAAINCAGNNNHLHLNLSNPYGLVSFYDGACAIADGVPYCISEKNDIRAPALHNIVQLANNGRDICALSNEGSTVCWGNAGAYDNILAVKAPFSFIALGSWSCGISNDQVNCWTSLFPTNENIPKFTEPMSVVASNFFTACGLDVYGIKCWGHDPRLNRVPKELTTPDEPPKPQPIPAPAPVPNRKVIPGDRANLYLALPGEAPAHTGTLNLICNDESTKIVCAAGIIENGQMTSLDGDLDLKSVLMPYLTFADGQMLGKISVTCIKNYAVECSIN